PGARSTPRTGGPGTSTSRTTPAPRSPASPRRGRAWPRPCSPRPTTTWCRSTAPWTSRCAAWWWPRRSRSTPRSSRTPAASAEAGPMHDAHPPMVAVREAVARALAEDLTPLGDLTSALLPPALEATARFVPRAAGILAGRLCAMEAFRQVDPGLEVAWWADDGDQVAAGVAVAEVRGPLAPILTAERTALHFLGHLSG